MDILDIFLDILLKPPQPLMGLFLLERKQNRRRLETAVLFQAVFVLEQFLSKNKSEVALASKGLGLQPISLKYTHTLKV